MSKQTPARGSEELLELDPIDRINEGLIISRDRLIQAGRLESDVAHRTFDLYAIFRNADAAGLDVAVVGDIALLAHGVMLAVEATELSVPERVETEGPLAEFLENIGATDPSSGLQAREMPVGSGTELLVATAHGPVSLRKSGPIPIDHETVTDRSISIGYALIAGLSSVVAEQRIRNPDDLVQVLATLQRASQDPLPLDLIPGIDVCISCYQGPGHARLTYDATPGRPPTVVHAPGCCLANLPPGTATPWAAHPRPLAEQAGPVDRPGCTEGQPSPHS